MRSGSDTCSWQNRPVFLPHWNYIPHNASGQEQEAGGYVELIGSPVLLCPGPEPGLADSPGGGAGLSRAVVVREAARLLLNRTRGQRVSVCGLVGSVCPLLVVSGTTFFCFSLTDGSHRLPVLVKSDTPTPLMMSHVDECECEEAEPEQDTVQSALRMKRSRVISYQGTVTEVVSEGAGLYVIDRKVGLCLAYQPTLRRTLRAGDSVELHHVHFLYRPCPDFSPSMLCTCLRSSIRVTAFSRVERSSPDSSCPGDGVLPRLLLEKNLGVSEYLWTCHLSSQLANSLVPSVLKQQCVCVSWTLMERVWKGRGGQRGWRDIYSEMLDEPHTCPLTQYSVDSTVHQYISVSDLTQSLQSDCWSSVSLTSLLPPGGSSLTRSQINAALAWSCRTVTSDPRTTTRLETDSGSAPCCWLACWSFHHRRCLVCPAVHHGNREIHPIRFPSYQHLDQDKYLTHKHCRVYLQFSLDHLHILSPSVAMGYTPAAEEGGGQQVVPQVQNGRWKKRKLREVRLGEEKKKGGPDSSTLTPLLP
ncbi:CST complex subunit CTC1 Conserved telomere maintenance component 1 [Larimichthys crocea]|uniref:CST complex subunit CTC1 n=1 Tax=Larimichthys crocea TaxID=215358 RepID=A0A6G0HDC2_LARCR|nr:CST complex subunit CTC1 Conserved telomere maintenance component 1 [Larimichthys crocea]